MSQKLKFGIMAKGESLEAWQYQCIQKLISSDIAEPALVIIAENAEKKKESFFQRLFRRTGLSKSRYLFFLLYNKIRVRKGSRAHISVDSRDIFHSVEKLKCKTFKKGKFSEYFNAEDVEAIKGYDLDFIVRFAFGIIRGDVLQAARYGVWSYHHDDETKYRGLPSCFWEIYNRDPVSGAILQRLTDRLDGGVILEKGYFPTNDNFRKNVENVHFGSADFCLRACQRIVAGDLSRISAEPTKSTAPIYLFPNNLQFIKFIGIQFSNFIRLVGRKIFYLEQWKTGVCEKTIEEFMDEHYRSEVQNPPEVEFEEKTRWLAKTSRDKFLADPFFVKKTGNGMQLLAEEYDFLTGKGYLVDVELDRNCAIVDKRRIMEGTEHMSYPFILQHQEKTYCIPEICERNSISLYEQVGDEWIYIKDLVEDFPGVDSTVIQHNDCWWLFATDKRDHPSTKLFIWYAKELLGDWLPHSLEPAKTDVQSSRSGGLPFFYKGKLFRPTQDCSSTYGGAVTINEISSLTQDIFEERPVLHIKPNRRWDYNQGLHTFVPFEGGIIVDSKRYEFSPYALYYKLKRRLNG